MKLDDDLDSDAGPTQMQARIWEDVGADVDVDMDMNMHEPPSWS